MQYFFFFKQKTAYEMRISDWSSDVCSSDLVAAPGLLAAEGASGAPARQPRSAAPLPKRGLRTALKAASKAHPDKRLQLWFQDERSEERRVGERVCQYV